MGLPPPNFIILVLKPMVLAIPHMFLHFHRSSTFHGVRTLLTGYTVYMSRWLLDAFSKRCDKKQVFVLQDRICQGNPMINHHKPWCSPVIRWYYKPIYLQLYLP